MKRRRSETERRMMMMMLKRSRLAVKLSVGFRPFSNSCSYDFSRFTKQYRHLINNKDTPLLVNHGNGFFQMLTSDILRVGKHAVRVKPPVSIQLPNEFLVCGPCNGLFCLYSVDGEVLLWNPGTGNNKSLTGKVRCDQKIKIWNVGFGFDSKADDHKIIRCITRYFLNPLYRSVDELIHQVEIYSLKTKQWREIPVPVEIRCNVPFLAPGSFADGSYYWTLEDNLDDDIRLISFDFNEEEFHLHALPVSPHGCKMDSYDGRPAAICYNRYGFQLWKGVRESGVTTWDCEIMIGPLNGYDFTPLCFWKEKGLILFDCTSHIILWYDFETKYIWGCGLSLHDLDDRMPKSGLSLQEKCGIQILSFPESSSQCMV